jgi:hypothetical protein
VGDHCSFVDRCIDSDCGARMPVDCQPLSQTDVDLVLDWIRQAPTRIRRAVEEGDVHARRRVGTSVS